MRGETRPQPHATKREPRARGSTCSARPRRAPARPVGQAGVLRSNDHDARTWPPLGHRVARGSQRPLTQNDMHETKPLPSLFLPSSSLPGKVLACACADEAAFVFFSHLLTQCKPRTQSRDLALPSP